MKPFGLIKYLAIVVVSIAGTEMALADAMNDRPRPDLTGVVQTQSGEPVNANVFIATAGPKRGPGLYCPSCYADCRKRTQTDANGKFEIQSLDPELRFQVLVVAKGFKPKYVDRVDPTNGPITVKLAPIEMAEAPPENCLHGRVLDVEGRPVQGAVVEFYDILFRNGEEIGGNVSGVDPLAVSDENGEFLITSKKPFATMDVDIYGSGIAKKYFNDLASGNATHALTVTEGASVTGRVLFHGQPLANVKVGLDSVDGTIGHFAGNYDISTDANGRFMFINLPPDTDYYVYGDMDSFSKMGAVPAQTVHTGKDGKTTDVGDMNVAPGFRLAGRVVLVDGAPIPPLAVLMVGREGTWDDTHINLPPDGHFDFRGIPAETVSLSVSALPGHRLSSKNASLDRLYTSRLIGRVEGDVTNMVILMEKGPDLPADFSMSSEDANQPEHKPLHGAEVGPDHSDQFAVSGRVTDERTDEPLANFRVTPGRAYLQWNRNNWDGADEVEGRNGDFTVYVNKKWPQAVLKAEADGYLPTSSILDTDQTNVSFSLKRGAGPGGYVVMDHKPVANAEVLLLCDDSEAPQLDPGGRLYTRPSTLLTSTTSDGHFEFAPQLGMVGVAAASSQGFAQISLNQLAANSNIVLAPYGVIKGVLNRPSAPGANEALDVQFNEPGVASVGGGVAISDHHVFVFNSATTDSNGRFEFDQVPAGTFMISSQIKMGEYGYRDEGLQSVTVKPGQTVTVSIKAAARQTNSVAQGRPAPSLERIAGQQIKGIVLLPDGKPAADAQVAERVPGRPLFLGYAEFSDSEAKQAGAIVNSGPDGRFTLPMFKGAAAVVALNDKGFAAVTLDELKRSPQVTLQPWGRIEGALRHGRHLATNELVALGQRSAPGQPQGITFAPSEFDVLTDDRGHFVMNDLPPGNHLLGQLVPIGNGARQYEWLGNVTINPGETTQFNFGGDERMVIGKVTLDNTNGTADFDHVQAFLESEYTFNMLAQLHQPKTQEGAARLFKSPGFQKAFANTRSVPVEIMADGSFKSPWVPPGKYEISLEFFRANDVFLSPNQVAVPAATNGDGDAVVNLGTIELKQASAPQLSMRGQ